MSVQHHIVRRLILVSSVMLIIGLFRAQGQSPASRDQLTPQFGIRGGVNLSNLYVNEADDEHMKAGLNAGVFLKLPLANGVALQPELSYSGKGSRIAYNSILGSGAFRFNLNYVELPVLFVFNIGKAFNIHAGGYAAYLTGANIKSVDDDGSMDEIASFDADDFNRMDFGVSGGIGLDIDKFSIGARYNYGLKEVGKDLSRAVLGNTKNNAVNLYIGIGF